MTTSTVSTRNRQIFSRRMAGETLVSLAAEYGLSRGQIRRIAITEQRIIDREQELEKADRLPDQPNALHLSPRLRRTLQIYFRRENISPLDILKVGFCERSIYKVANFQQKYWPELVQWMGRAGYSPET